MEVAECEEQLLVLCLGPALCVGLLRDGVVHAQQVGSQALGGLSRHLDACNRECGKKSQVLIIQGTHVWLLLAQGPADTTASLHSVAATLTAVAPLMLSMQVADQAGFAH